MVEDTSKAAVVEALRAGDVDVDAALKRGQLTFHSVEETYHRNDEFRPDEMVAFYTEAVAEATEEHGALRVAAETGWLLDDSTDLEDWMEYEARVNKLCDDEDCLALCQYDRTRVPPDVLRDLVQTHPHLVYGGTVCHNFYYTPPEEFCGPAKPEYEADRMLGTLKEQAEAKTKLTEHKQFLERLNETIADPDLSFEEKLQTLFDLGCERFDMELGGLNRVDPERDLFRPEYLSDEHELLESGVELSLSETFCAVPVEAQEPAGVTSPVEEGDSDITIYEEYGAEAYFGTYIPVEGGQDRTLAFIATEPRPEPFSDEERTYLELMGQWVKYELKQQEYQQDLEETVTKLQQSNDRLKQFAYAASHDLQEPLRMVSSYLQLLEDRYGGELDEQARKYIDFAVDGADRMRAMVNDLLSFSRVEQADERFESVDCDDVLRQVIADLRVQIEENDAEIGVGSLPTVRADPEQLEQLFDNLLSNAIKYNDSAPPRVEIDAEERSDCWEFTFADNGIGIDPNKTDQIFEVFKRLHTDEEYSGTGIGLSLCQEIVEHHGGEIRVQSEPGDGSTFHVTLPK